jgi:TM2 domain-containing membrane protein YozV
MIKKKNSFLTFIFSLIPGAGQMYLGFMKRGLSLMSCFFFIILIENLLVHNNIGKF